jgi:hypothetical protein
MVKMEKRINAKLKAISNNAANEKPKETQNETFRNQAYC